MAGEELLPDRPDTASADAEPANFVGRDQTLSEDDQTGADLDQTVSDVDQTASDRDQLEADRSGRDTNDDDAVWSATRRSRSQNTIDRDISSHARHEAAGSRDANAQHRDADADVRDLVARERDELMAAMDAEMQQLERSDNVANENGALSQLERSVSDRRRAAAARERSVHAREEAARDRAAARSDRQRAAQDRRAAQTALAADVLDDLTGALRRNGGIEGMRREIERTRRTKESLTVAFIDVNHLKRVNDQHGHAAGDDLLRDVVTGIKRILRPYDLILRFGGDEFVCVLSGHHPAGLAERFEQLAADLAGRHYGAGITVGFAEAEAEESAEQLLVRADEAMIATRREQRIGR
jgi:diguanylate cyclase (GGDEF)-like protein